MSNKKVFIDDGYPKEGLYELMDQWKGKVVDRHVEEEIGVTRNPDIVALANDPKSWVKTSPFSKMRTMTPEANAESMRLHELETNAYQGYEVWAETNSIDEGNVRNGETDHRSNFQDQYTIKYPHAPDPHGYYISKTEKTIDDGSGRIDDYHELRQKLIPATDDPFGEYVGLQNEVVVNPNMPSYSDGVIPDTEVRSVGGEDSRVNLYEAKLIDDFGSVGETMVKDIGSGDIGPDGKRRYQVASGDFEFGIPGTFAAMAKMQALKRKEAEEQRRQDKIDERQRVDDITKAGTGIYKGLSAMDQYKKGRTEEFTGKFDTGDADALQIFKKTEDEKLGGFSPFKGIKSRIELADPDKQWSASEQKKLKAENPRLWKMMKKHGVKEGAGETMNIGDTVDQQISFGRGKGIGMGSGSDYKLDAWGDKGLNKDLTGIGVNKNIIDESKTNFEGKFRDKDGMYTGKDMSGVFSEDAKTFDADADQFRLENPDVDLSGMSTDEIRKTVDDWRNRSDAASEADYEEQYKVEEGTDRGRTHTEDQQTIYPTEGPEKGWAAKAEAEQIRNEDIQKMQNEYPGSKPEDLEKWYNREGKFDDTEGMHTASSEEMTYEDAQEILTGDTSSSVEEFVPDLDNVGLERDAALIQDTEITESLAVDEESVLSTVDANSAGNTLTHMVKGAAKNEIMKIGMEVGGDMLVDAGMDPEAVETGKDAYAAAKTVKSAYDTVKTAKAAKDVGTAAVGTAGTAGGAVVPGLNIASGAFQMLTADEPADQIAGGVTALGGALMFTPLAPLGAVMVAGSSLWSIFSG